MPPSAAPTAAASPSDEQTLEQVARPARVQGPAERAPRQVFERVAAGPAGERRRDEIDEGLYDEGPVAIGQEPIVRLRREGEGRPEVDGEQQAGERDQVRDGEGGQPPDAAQAAGVVKEDVGNIHRASAFIGIEATL